MSRLLVLIVALVVGACTGNQPSPSAEPPSTVGPSATPADSPPLAEPSPTTPPTAKPTPTPPAHWSAVAAAGAGPSPREDHTWTVDPATATAYLFGGRDGSRAQADLWAYDLATDAWRALTPGNQGPDARFGHEAVWLAGRGLVVFAGQASATQFYNDLWLYEPELNSWTKLPNGGATPVPRYGSCSAIGPDGRLWISHGFTEDGTRFADTRAYDFDADAWEDVTPTGQVPVERCLHGCWFTDDDRFVLYAGQTTGVEALADLWVLDGPGTSAAAWVQVEGDLPDDRNLYAFARHGADVVVVGGRGRGATYRADAWRFGGSPLAVTPLAVEGPTPPGRAGATLIDDPARGRMLLFGGKTASGALADLWELG